MDGGAAELPVLEQIPQTYSNQQHFNIFSIDSQRVAREGEEKKTLTLFLLPLECQLAYSALG